VASVVFNVLILFLTVQQYRAKLQRKHRRWFWPFSSYWEKFICKWTNLHQDKASFKGVLMK